MGIIVQEGSEEVSESRMLQIAGISVWKLALKFHDFSSNLGVTVYGTKCGSRCWVFSRPGRGEQLRPDVVRRGALCAHGREFTISVGKTTRGCTLHMWGCGVGKEGRCVGQAEQLYAR